MSLRPLTASQSARLIDELVGKAATSEDPRVLREEVVDAGPSIVRDLVRRAVSQDENARRVAVELIGRRRGRSLLLILPVFPDACPSLVPQMRQQLAERLKSLFLGFLHASSVRKVGAKSSRLRRKLLRR